MTIKQQLTKIKQENRLGLMTHVVVGYPSLTETINLVQIMEKAGTDFVELQIPFSDPIADGPTIMKACDDSLKNGTKVKDCFSVMDELTKRIHIPLLFMGYYNSVYSYRTKQFIQEAKRVGCAGLIIPDIPPEEECEEHFAALCQRFTMPHIRVLSPASTPERIQKNATYANGFVYLVSQYGTTGSGKGMDKDLGQTIKRMRKYIHVPIAVGFGISNKSHIDILKSKADIAVIGSAIIDIIDKQREKNYYPVVSQFIKSLRG